MFATITKKDAQSLQAKLRSVGSVHHYDPGTQPALLRRAADWFQELERDTKERLIIGIGNGGDKETEGTLEALLTESDAQFCIDSLQVFFTKGHEEIQWLLHILKQVKDGKTTSISLQ